MSKRTIAALALMIILPLSSVFAAEENLQAQLADKIALLANPNAPIPGANGKQAAVTFLLDNAEAAAPLMADTLVTSNDDQARLWILLALNQADDYTPFEDAAEGIVGLLEKEDNFGLQYWSIKVLAKMQAPEAVRPLQDILESENHLLREAAAEGLGTLGNITAADSLVNLLKDEETTVRAAAAESLGKLKAPGAKTVLVALVQADDENLIVKRAAIVALENITGTSSGLKKTDWGPSAADRAQKIETFLNSI